MLRQSTQNGKNLAKLSGTMLALICSVSFFLSSCSENESSHVTPTRLNKTADDISDKDQSKTVDQQNLSDLEADAGEGAITPSTLDEAYAHFNKALSLDPQNTRAGFWKSFLPILLEFKGIASRVRPLYHAAPQGDKRYAKMIASISSGSPYRAFLLSGGAPIQTTDDFQEWLDRCLLRLSEFRNFLHGNENKQILIHASNEMIGGIQLSGQNARSIDFILNEGDFVSLEAVIAMMETEFAMINAYRFVPQSLPTLFDSNKYTHIEIIKKLAAEGSGELRHQQHLATLKDSGKEILLAVNYVLRSQPEMCKTGHSSAKNRKKHLFENGACIHFDDQSGQTEEQKTADVLETILSGHSVAVTGNDPNTAIELLPLKFIEDPLGDLKSLLPYDEDQCGGVTQINVTPLNRYVVSGDLFAYLRHNTSVCPSPLLKEEQ